MFTYKDEKHEEKTVEFYHYYECLVFIITTLKKHGLKLKDSLISYEIKNSSDGKNLIKAFKHPYYK